MPVDIVAFLGTALMGSLWLLAGTGMAVELWFNER